jgi:hypothetical protein
MPVEKALQRKQSLDQAARFLPGALGAEDPDLTWIKVVEATRRLGEAAEALPSSDVKADSLAGEKEKRFEASRAELTKQVQKLVDTCTMLEARWVAEQRVFQIKQVRTRAERLLKEIGKSTLTLQNWHEVEVTFQ